MIMRFASEIAGKELGIHWVDCFARRYKGYLISKYAPSIDRVRHQADTPANYTLYFNLVGQKIQEYEIEPRHMYNMDERGFLTGQVKNSKRWFTRREYEQGKIRSKLQDGNREWVTLVACICADGTQLQTSLIFQAASGGLQDPWLQSFDPAIHSA